ncbi:MAG: hypothetical protein OEM02_10645 [Desulfobulbaceae bacterium]|nr:hypothetical protein [Desulfobulbaceae bacterium]
MKKETQYTFVKQSKRKRPLGGYDAVWQANDHFLVVENNGYTQSYKRFYFSDIQALILRVTKRHLIYAWCFGIGALLSFFSAYFLPWPENTPFLIFGLLFTILFGVNWYKGPTCKSSLITRVQSHPLHLVRLKIARRIFFKWRKIIEQEQGVLDLSTVMEPLPVSLENGSVKMNSAVHSKRVMNYKYGGGYHLLFFSMMLLVAVLNGTQLYTRHVALSITEMLMYAGGWLAMILALKNQNSSAMSSMLKKNTWVAMLLILVVLIVGYYYTVIVASQSGSPQIIQNQAQIFLYMVNRNPADFPFLKFELIFTSISFSLVSIFGLIQTMSFQKKRSEL